ncbi:glyoxalase [Mesorhizobium sp. B2-9-1]|uniref:VOC family protein n=1 Tax=unclassified Mesorhizobium TaxID=325217 RepID=UPI00112604F9|nr:MULTISPECIES: VOC family protein [unclassified Mesorhizobium]TPI46223.1 glyoxalase [Mesorhizobium sp. B2-9-1]TPJ30700.1 glyoxalase [Mesorhizobium sp. B2-7-2]
MRGPINADSEPIDPRVRVGHVHLKVADLERSLAFYCGVLGFGLQGLLEDEAAFLAAGGYHHHLAINTWESRGGSPPPEGSTGLHHIAFVYPTRAALGRAFRRLRAAGVQLIGASDHGGTEAIYLRDPDDNGVELYWDRPEKEWPRNADGSLKIVNSPLDVENLASEGSSVPPEGER